MLELNIHKTEMFDEKTDTFFTIPSQKIQLEHSLISVSKWESKWHVPFLNITKTMEQSLDYIACMTINKTDGNFVRALSKEDIDKVYAYMENPMSATKVNNYKKQRPKNEIITSEVLYADMIELGIPDSFEKWHLNRLLMLINVLAARQNPGKMSKSEILKQNAALNAARKSKLHSRG